MLGCIYTQKPAASVKLVPFYYEAVVGQKDSLLAFICYGSFLFSYLFLSNILEQLNHSVSFGCPLQQDYSLLNLLAAFSIILSYVSLPSCAFTSM